LSDIVEKLHDWDIVSMEWKKNALMRLMEARQYLRTDYKIHLKEISRVADHCLRYALSDVAKTEYRSDCDNGDPTNEHHIHGLKCDRCELIKSVLGDVEDVVNELDGDVAQHALAKTDVASAIIKIVDMKRHIARATHSEMQRQSIIASLSNRRDHALITIDWAQKYLPISARESQRVSILYALTIYSTL